MSVRIRRYPKQPVWALSLLSMAVAIVWTAHFLPAQEVAAPTDASFDQIVKPFLKQNCVRCHNVDNSTAGIRVDLLDAKFDDNQVKIWEAVQHRIRAGTMPPKGMPQPTAAERQQMNEWIGPRLEIARLRPAPKNGLVRRLTVAQYRNTLRELLLVDTDLTSILPPDAVSKDGFLNNRDTLQLSPAADGGLFRDRGESARPRDRRSGHRSPRSRISAWISAPASIPRRCRRSWCSEPEARCWRTQTFWSRNSRPPSLSPSNRSSCAPNIGSSKDTGETIRSAAGGITTASTTLCSRICAEARAIRKEAPGALFPQGLLLRPAIPTEEMFDDDGTYGPKANFKISLRELPDEGRFRVTVTAAKYNDGLLLDPGARAAQTSKGIVWNSVKTPGTRNHSRRPAFTRWTSTRRKASRPLPTRRALLKGSPERGRAG